MGVIILFNLHLCLEKPFTHIWLARIFLFILIIITTTTSTADPGEKQHLDKKKGIESIIKLLEDLDPDVRASAAIALGVIRNPRAIGPLIKALGNISFPVRKNAAWALGEIGNSQAVGPLIKALDDYIFHVRESAVWALLKIGDKRAIDPLFKVLGDRNSNVREAAAITLEKLGEPWALIIHESLKWSEGAIEKLTNEMDIQLFEKIAKSSDYWDSRAREAAVWILGRRNDKRTIDFLIRRITDEQPKVRVAAIWSLVKTGSVRAVGPVIKALDDNASHVRQAAAWALGETGNTSATKPLIRSLEDVKPKVRENAIKSLGTINDKLAINPIIKALSDTNINVRIAAATVLGKLGDSSNTDILIKALNDEEDEVQEATIWSLSKIGDQRAVYPLIKTLEDPSPIIRRAAAFALGQIGGFRAVNSLIMAIGDSENEVQKAVVSALKKLNEPLGLIIYESIKGNQKSMEDLVIKRDNRVSVFFIEALNNEKPEVRQAAALYLGEIMEVRALDGLIFMASGTHFKDRFYGMIAISKLDIDSVLSNFSLALKIFTSLPSIIYFMLLMLIFTIIICNIPFWRMKIHIIDGIALSSLLSGILFSLPAISFTCTYFAFLTTIIVPFLCVSLIISFLSLSTNSNSSQV